MTMFEPNRNVNLDLTSFICFIIFNEKLFPIYVKIFLIKNLIHLCKTKLTNTNLN
jgi:hypothetical protein